MQNQTLPNVRGVKLLLALTTFCTLLPVARGHAGEVIDFPYARICARTFARIPDAKVLAFPNSGPEFPQPSFPAPLVELGSHEALTAASFAMNARQQADSFGSLQYAAAFQHTPRLESERVYSTLTADRQFDLSAALNAAERPPVLLSSGLARKFLFGQMSQNWRLGGQSLPVGQINILDHLTPEQFQNALFGPTGPLVTYQTFLNADLSRVHVAKIRIAAKSTSQLTASEDQLQQEAEKFPGITYIQENLSNFSPSAALTTLFGSVDVITDYAGLSLTESDFGSVLQRYNQLLRENGYLFLAIPIEKAVEDGATVFTRFEIKIGDSQNAAAGDDFFAHVPGFTMRSAYFIDDNLGMTATKDFNTLVVILQKVRTLNYKPKLRTSVDQNSSRVLTLELN